MPIRPTHRLDIHLVPLDRGDAALLQVQELWDTWVADGFLEPSGKPGPRAQSLVDGGFVRARRDDPGTVVLYANQVGGFRVQCPTCDAALAREFRAQEPTRCPSCGGVFEVEDLVCRPAVARGRASLVLADVGHFEVAAGIPHGFTVVHRRV
jgi:hypothetical protein